VVHEQSHGNLMNITVAGVLSIQLCRATHRSQCSRRIPGR
jgi:hypothetical protein